MVEMALKNVYKKYDNAENYSVTDFNLSIKDREFIVFVGPSGCGKSTTLRMIAGLEDISEGELNIGGKVMNDVAPKDRDIAMVFQNYALYPHMTVFDNMAFGLKLRKYDKADIKKRVDNAAEILGLTEYLKRKPAALSGGQRQRVALGRAIVRDAKVFLMDEPLSNLDAKLRVAIVLIDCHNLPSLLFAVFFQHIPLVGNTGALPVKVIVFGKPAIDGCPEAACQYCVHVCIFISVHHNRLPAQSRRNTVLLNLILIIL